MRAFHRTIFLILLALAGLTADRLPAQTPHALVAGFQIDSVMVTQGYPNRLAYEAVSGRLYYCLPGGDIYAISLPAGQSATETRIATFADHGIQHPQGLHIRDSVLYVSGFTEGPPRMVLAHISKGTLQANGTRTWATVASTQSHPYSKHPFTSVISDPAGEYLYWASGARTMAGEIWSDNGAHPGRRESPYNGRLFRIPIDTLGMVLPADSATLDNSGFVYCRGLRNAFDMDWDAAGNLFAIDNSGERNEHGELLFSNVSFSLMRGDKVGLIGKDSVTLTTFFEVLAGKQKPDTGTIEFGQTITVDYLPNENHEFFSGDMDMDLIAWLREFSKEKDEQFIRSFLGRMLFKGEEVNKKVSVLSGGEKVRCMFSKIMLAAPNFLLLDEPTNHLDLESVTVLNTAMKDFIGCMIYTSHDFEIMNSVGNRIIELRPDGFTDKMCNFEEFLKLVVRPV